MDMEVFMVARWVGGVGDQVKRRGDEEIRIGNYRTAMGMYSTA